ncbi:MAG: transposase [Casimicrobiaceae bacterium]
MQARLALVSVALLVLLGGCGKLSEEQAKQEAAKQLQDAGKQMEQAAKDMEAAAKQGGEGLGTAMAKMGMAVGGVVTGAAKSVGTAVEPVDFRELKTLLPDGIGALKRTSAEGEKGGGFGFVVSHAEARYDGVDGHATVKITDPGNLSGMAAMAAMWMNIEMDKETDTGYEKTGSAGGRRFHEKYDKSSKSGEYTVIIGNRFMVEVDGSGIDMATMKKAVEQINLAKLESMKDVGVAK